MKAGDKKRPLSLNKGLKPKSHEKKSYAAVTFFEI